MKKNYLGRIFIFALITIMAGVLLTGCGQKLTEADVSYGSEITDNVLEGIKDKNYNKFSRDFSDTMKNAITEQSFNSLTGNLNTKIGDYKSKAFSGASKTKKDNKEYTVVVYKAKYTKETGDVLITITFSDNNGKNMVDGLYFKSPNLAK
ncbi:DUF3887 domain-containing protein [Clostridium sp. JN-9]|uniref:DUF3887 domain-containing protein n=1 Tax=Clostridium sp. JN-9 TaxID=2507159 RepID=UPI000FFE2886|nr:DUF3887 domain-containing protein [Clostridium sp. JN-9]QAT40897.1 DUF3887 domain-containing protein [Clostridium sp. JN-9]